MRDSMPQVDNAVAVESIYKISRRIKKTENTVYNALRSIYEDSLFVREIRSLWPELPLMANLRCGLWYASKFDGACYFKSTDGHNSNWSFNTGRLNLHVLQLAAERGGCFIVDATRKGKRFPDAMSKTIPIWTCVVNRALADYRTLRAQASRSSTVQNLENFEMDGDLGEGISKPLVSSEEDWDSSLHLPSWVSNVERGNIESRLNDWVLALKSLSLDLESLSTLFKKPLRPLWISQNSLIWLNEVPELDEWPFTPIILISASRPSVFTQRYTDERFSWSYIPGAADDEESWARGLTPGLFWRHNIDIFQDGPTACNAKVADIVERDRVHRAIRGNVAPQIRVKAPEVRVVQDPTSESAANGSLNRGDEGSHTPLRPVVAPGCDSREVTQEHSTLEKQVRGLYWIGDTGIAVGNEQFGARNDVYTFVNSVINCGASSHPPSCERVDDYLFLPILSSKFDRTSLLRHLADAVLYANRQLSGKRTVLVYCCNGEDISVCVSLAILLSLNSKKEGKLNATSSVTKCSVREHLIYLSSFHPDARPSRGNLKQVFNFFNASEQSRQ